MGNQSSNPPRKRGLKITKDFQSSFLNGRKAKTRKSKSFGLSRPPELKLDDESSQRRLIRPHGIDFITPTPPPMTVGDENGSHKHRPEVAFDLTEGQNRRNLMSDAEFECSEIGEYLYVGGAKVATSWETIQSKGITRVINCSASVVECAFAEYPNMKYLVLNMVDGKQDDISWYFCEVINFIYTGYLLGEKTLLHCEKGISRSCSFAIAYGIWHARCGWRVAFDFIKERRKVCAPNTAFTCNLIEIDDMLNGTSRYIPLIFRCASHLAHDTHTPVLKLLRDQSTRRILTPSTSLLDSRGVFVIRTPENDQGIEPVIYVWKGKDATEETAEIAKRLAGYQVGIISEAEKVIVILEGQEPDEFYKYVEKNGHFDKDKSRSWDDLFDLTKMLEPDETFQFISVDRSMRASHNMHEITESPPFTTTSGFSYSPSSPSRSRILPYESTRARNGSSSYLPYTSRSRLTSSMNSSIDDRERERVYPVHISGEHTHTPARIQPIRTSSSNTRSFTLNFHHSPPIVATTGSSQSSSQSTTNTNNTNTSTTPEQQQQQKDRAVALTLDIPKKSPISTFLRNSTRLPSLSAATGMNSNRSDANRQGNVDTNVNSNNNTTNNNNSTVTSPHSTVTNTNTDALITNRVNENLAPSPAPTNRSDISTSSDIYTPRHHHKTTDLTNTSLQNDTSLNLPSTLFRDNQTSPLSQQSVGVGSKTSSNQSNSVSVLTNVSTTGTGTGTGTGANDTDTNLVNDAMVISNKVSNKSIHSSTRNMDIDTTHSDETNHNIAPLQLSTGGGSGSKPPIVPLLSHHTHTHTHTHGHPHNLPQLDDMTENNNGMNTNRYTLNFETSRSSSTMSMSVGPVYYLNSDRLDTLSQDFSPRAPNMTTSRSADSSNNITSRMRTPIAPLSVPKRPEMSNKLPDDISLIRGPTPIEELIPVITGEVTSRELENPLAAVYSPQFAYTPRTARTGRSNVSLTYTMDGGYLNSSNSFMSIPGSPSMLSKSNYFSTSINKSRDIRRSNQPSALINSPSLNISSSSASNVLTMSPERIQYKPRLFMAVTEDGKQYTWEFMGVYDEDDLLTNRSSILLLSVPNGAQPISYLWIGKESFIPFFNRKTGEVVNVSSSSLTEVELKKWVKLVKIKKYQDLNSNHNNTVIPYEYEKKLRDENIMIERSSQESERFWSDFCDGF